MIYNETSFPGELLLRRLENKLNQSHYCFRNLQNKAYDKFGKGIVEYVFSGNFIRNFLSKKNPHKKFQVATGLFLCCRSYYLF